RQELRGERLLRALAEEARHRVVRARDDALGVGHGHGLHGIDQERPCLGYRLLGGAIDARDQVVELLLPTHHPHRALHPLQAGGRCTLGLPRKPSVAPRLATAAEALRSSAVLTARAASALLTLERSSARAAPPGTSQSNPVIAAMAATVAIRLAGRVLIVKLH